MSLTAQRWTWNILTTLSKITTRTSNMEADVTQMCTYPCCCLLTLPHSQPLKCRLWSEIAFNFYLLDDLNDVVCRGREWVIHHPVCDPFDSIFPWCFLSRVPPSPLPVQLFSMLSSHCAQVHYHPFPCFSIPHNLTGKSRSALWSYLPLSYYWKASLGIENWTYFISVVSPVPRLCS